MTAIVQNAERDGDGKLSPSPGAASLNRRIVPYVFFSFACYLVIGIQLAVLPGYVHLTLGFSTVLAGLSISAEYVATVVTRPFAGWVVDRRGAKYSVLVGLMLCGASGAMTLVSGLFHALPWLGLTLLLTGRLLLGASESLVATGATVWGIFAVGTENTATVISWNGICTYGGVAAGAPIGVFLVSLLGFPAIGVAGMLLGFASIALALRLPGAGVIHGEKLPYHHVFGRVAPFGVGLGLGSIGFGVLATFITLDFAHQHWTGAAFALTLFGALFIFARLLFADWINRAGGFVVATACFSVETLGLLTLWLAHTRSMVFAGAALTGFGFSLVFPALGVEAVREIPPQDKGTALGAYGVFMDFSLMITGPVAGAIIGGYGYPRMYLFAGCSVLGALLLTVALGAVARSRRFAGLG